MSTKIPKSFYLFATKINVVIDDVKCDIAEAYGLSEYFKSEITLATKDGINEISDGKRMDSFYHEKIHIILDTMNRHDLSKDENFVDILAKLLRQSDETAAY